MIIDISAVYLGADLVPENIGIFRDLLVQRTFANGFMNQKHTGDMDVVKNTRFLDHGSTKPWVHLLFQKKPWDHQMKTMGPPNENHRSTFLKPWIYFSDVFETLDFF